MIILAMLGVTAYIGLSSLFFSVTQAEEYSPLDFTDNYNKFVIILGFDQVNGRYATYHYEFSE